MKNWIIDSLKRPDFTRFNDPMIQWADDFEPRHLLRLSQNFLGAIVSNMAHMVKCVKLGRESIGLDEPPFDNELGQRIYNNVSKEAWDQWGHYMKMLLNEYRLQPWRKEHQEFIAQQMENYFFGDGGKVPDQYTPESK